MPYKPNCTYIAEFTVIAPTNDIEAVGEVYSITPFGEYCPPNSLRAYNLLYLLDHPLHYRVSKIIMNKTGYIIPADREKNYMPKLRHETMKYYLETTI